MIKLKKPAAVILTAVMMLSFCSCSEGQGKEQQQSGDGYHFHWKDYALFETIGDSAKVELKDDFAAAVNYEWASKQKEDFTYPISSIGEVNRKVVHNKRAMVDDKSFQNKAH